MNAVSSVQVSGEVARRHVRSELATRPPRAHTTATATAIATATTTSDGTFTRTSAIRLSERVPTACHRLRRGTR